MLSVKFWSVTSFRFIFTRRDLFTFDPGFSEETRGEYGVEGRRHGYDGQVFGADTAVLPRHVRMERISRFGNGAAQHATVARTHGVFVLQMCPQRVRRTVDFTC